MVAILVGTLALAGVLAGGYIVARFVAAARDNFDELLPQRMVDYAGFVQYPLGRD